VAAPDALDAAPGAGHGELEGVHVLRPGVTGREEWKSSPPRPTSPSTAEPRRSPAATLHATVDRFTSNGTLVVDPCGPASQPGLEPVPRMRSRRPVSVGLGDGHPGDLAPGLGPAEDEPTDVFGWVTVLRRADSRHRDRFALTRPERRRPSTSTGRSLRGGQCGTRRSRCPARRGWPEPLPATGWP
jgi:hypothetical protein